MVAPIPADRLAEVGPLLVDPAVSCFPEARLFPSDDDRRVWGGPQCLGHWNGDRLTAAVVLGANLIPVATDDGSRRLLAGELLRMGRRCSSIVGPAAESLPLWDLLAPSWGPAREVRTDQPLLAISGQPLVEPDPDVRPVPESRIDDYLPASVAMFTEEVGVSPMAGGAGPLYRQRVVDLLRAGRAVARWHDGRVLFKAELGAVTPRAVQIQGVWVDPAYRGRGLAAAGMAAVVRYALGWAPIVSLYVNSFNTAALATYRRVGFTQVGTFSTVLF